MKFTLDMSSADPADWKLLRYGEPAGTATERPGNFDNAHLAFWQRIETLETEAGQVNDALGILDLCQVVPFVDGLKKEIESLRSERDRFCGGLHDVVESWGADCMFDEAKEALNGTPRPEVLKKK